MMAVFTNELDRGRVIIALVHRRPYANPIKKTRKGVFQHDSCGRQLEM